MKTCTKCGKAKPREKFARRSERIDGRSNQCIDCEKEVAIARRKEIKKRKEFEII